MNTLRIAWRNILRNKRRTAVTVTAVTLNAAILIVSLALMDGMLQQAKANATQVMVGQVQIHATGYRADRSMYRSIPHPAPLIERAETNGLAVAPRSYGVGLVSHGNKSAGASFWGVDPGRERAAFTLADRMLAGQFVTNRVGDDMPGAVIGRKLARSLNVEVGDELVAVVQAADGSMGNELFRIAGILRNVGEDTDRTAVILAAPAFRRLFVSGDRIHELAIGGRNAHDPDAIRKVFATAVANPDLAVESWRELLPGFSDMLNISEGSMFIFGLVFVLAAGLGVLNTMLMATHDRIREYGVIKAIGAGPGRIIKDVIAEAAMLALVANALGVVIAVAASTYLSSHGIDLSAMGGEDISFSGIAFDPVWRAALSPGAIVYTVITMTIASMLAGLYPAIRAARLAPVRAMTHV